MTLPNGGTAREHAAAEALDRYWDALLTSHPGGPSLPAELLEPGLTRTVRQLRFTDQAPGPDPAFAARLRGDLLAAGPAPVPASAAAAGTAGVGGRLLGWSRHRFLVELGVAAALLIVVLGGGVALRLPVTLAPVVAPTAAASGGAPALAGPAGEAACVLTVTPEPTHGAGALRPPAATAPAPTTRAGPAATC